MTRATARRGRRLFGVSAWLACALAVILALPAPALARRTVVIRGRGWGHGIGMSQYGAYGRALKGKGARRILTHYYSGARVRRVRVPRRVRVGLLQSRQKIAVTSRARRERGGRIVFKVSGSRRRIAAGGPRVSWRLEPSRTGGVRLYRNGDRVKRRGRTVFGGPERPLRVLYSRRGTLARLKQKRLNYAYGRIVVGTHSIACRRAFCLRAVLVLGMQKYVYGLGEVPASWPQAVLRAQAIAARTYAVGRIRDLGQRREPCDCALYDSALDQVYSGDAKRTSSGQYWDDWKRAVDATKGRALVFRKKPIDALYSSSSGGHTENNENVWGGRPIPYLRGVRDRTDAVAANPNHRWRVRMRWSTFASRLDAAFGIGKLRKVRLVRPFGVSGRVTIVKSSRRGGVRIVGSSDTDRVSGWAMRSALGLRDTWFRIRIAYGVAARARAVYERTGGVDGPLGRPTSGRVRSGAGDGAWSQRFVGGAVYVTPGRAPIALWGAIAERYRRLGEASSRCGAPTSSVAAEAGRDRASFESGFIETGRDGAATVRCGVGGTEDGDGEPTHGGS